MVSGTLIRGIAAALLMCVLIFEAASLWWFVRRFNRMNEAQIRRVYAASIF